MKMKNKLLIIFFCIFHIILCAQEKIDNEIDYTALSLGMLDYPREKMENSVYDDVVQILSDKKQNFSKNSFFIEAIKKIGSVNPNDIKTEKRGKYIWIKSKSIVNILNSHLIFYPFTRKETLKKEFRNKNVEEGYINPYIFSSKQQKSFILGFLISKGSINKRNKELYIEGDYRLNFKKSKMFYDIVISFLENTGFTIISSEIRQHHYQYGYESFFATITLNVPEKYKNFIDKKIERSKN